MNNPSLSGRVFGLKLDEKNGLVIAFSNSLISNKNLLIWDHTSDLKLNVLQPANTKMLVFHTS
jgi:hypothetical protein